MRFICHYESISEQLPVATFKAPVATCGEWQQLRLDTTGLKLDKIVEYF